METSIIVFFAHEMSFFDFFKSKPAPAEARTDAKPEPVKGQQTSSGPAPNIDKANSLQDDLAQGPTLGDPDNPHEIEPFPPRKIENLVANINQWATREQELEASQRIPRSPRYREGIPFFPNVDDIIRSQALLIGSYMRQAGFDEEDYGRYVLATIYRLAAYIELIPASERHHHREPGGLFRHLIESGLFAVQIAQSMIFSRSGTPKERDRAKKAWTLAALMAGIFHDIGKSVYDVRVTDAQNPKVVWDPFTESLRNWGVRNNVKAYFVDWKKNRTPNRHEIFNSVLMDIIMPRAVKDFIASSTPDDIRATLIESITGIEDKYRLRDVMRRADQASCQSYCRENDPEGEPEGTNIFSNYVLRALQKLVETGEWQINAKGSPVIYAEDSVFVLWNKQTAGRVRRFLREQYQIEAPGDSAVFAHRLVQEGFCRPYGRQIQTGDEGGIELVDEVDFWMMTLPGTEGMTPALKLTQPRWLVQAPAMPDPIYVPVESASANAPRDEAPQLNESNESVSRAKRENESTEQETSHQEKDVGADAEAANPQGEVAEAAESTQPQTGEKKETVPGETPNKEQGTQEKAGFPRETEAEKSSKTQNLGSEPNTDSAENQQNANAESSDSNAASSNSNKKGSESKNNAEEKAAVPGTKEDVSRAKQECQSVQTAQSIETAQSKEAVGAQTNTSSKDPKAVLREKQEETTTPRAEAIADPEELEDPMDDAEDGTPDALASALEKTKASLPHEHDARRTVNEKSVSRVKSDVRSGNQAHQQKTEASENGPAVAGKPDSNSQNNIGLQTQNSSEQKKNDEAGSKSNKEKQDVPGEKAAGVSRVKSSDGHSEDSKSNFPRETTNTKSTEKGESEKGRVQNPTKENEQVESTVSVPESSSPEKDESGERFPRKTMKGNNQNNSVQKPNAEEAQTASETSDAVSRVKSDSSQALGSEPNKDSEAEKEKAQAEKTSAAEARTQDEDGVHGGTIIDAGGDSCTACTSKEADAVPEKEAANESSAATSMNSAAEDAGEDAGDADNGIGAGESDKSGNSVNAESTTSVCSACSGSSAPSICSPETKAAQSMSQVHGVDSDCDIDQHEHREDRDNDSVKTEVGSQDHAAAYVAAAAAHVEVPDVHHEHSSSTVNTASGSVSVMSSSPGTDKGKAKDIEREPAKEKTPFHARNDEKTSGRVVSPVPAEPGMKSATGTRETTCSKGADRTSKKAEHFAWNKPAGNETSYASSNSTETLNAPNGSGQLVDPMAEDDDDAQTMRGAARRPLRTRANAFPGDSRERMERNARTTEAAEKGMEPSGMIPGSTDTQRMQGMPLQDPMAESSDEGRSMSKFAKKRQEKVKQGARAREVLALLRDQMIRGEGTLVDEAVTHSREQCWCSRSLLRRAAKKSNLPELRLDQIVYDGRFPGLRIDQDRDIFIVDK